MPLEIDEYPYKKLDLIQRIDKSFVLESVDCFASESPIFPK